MATFVVGDIQACYSGLEKLLEKVEFNPKKDKLWAVGDLIGRGPEACQTLEFLMSLGDNFNTVLGNHDLHFLAVSQGIKESRDKEGFGEILKSKNLDKLIYWLRHRPLSAVPKRGFFLTHAGLYPLWNEQQAHSLARETSKVLKGKKWKKLLEYMYGSEEEKWSTRLSGLAKHKFVIDAFTRMRYVDDKARLNLKIKTSPKDAPKELFPWFEHPSLKHDSQLLFGHWASLEGECSRKRAFALDTGYIWGGKLTLLNLDTLKTMSYKAS